MAIAGWVGTPNRPKTSADVSSICGNDSPYLSMKPRYVSVEPLHATPTNST